MIPIVGFVGHDDSRARATFERTVSELSADGFVYRYVTDGVDGLSGEEATFAIPQAFSHVGLIQAAIALDLPRESMTAMTGEKEGFP
jgi:GH15 family glucan-1,4-alpha-glucosidase